VIFSKVAEELDSKLKEKFEKLGLILYRNYVGIGECSIDPWKLKKWPEMFKTKDKKIVEEKCKKDEQEVEWVNNSSSLRLINRIPAFKTHKNNGKKFGLTIPMYFIHHKDLENMDLLQNIQEEFLIIFYIFCF